MTPFEPLVTVHTDDGDDYEATVVEAATDSLLVRPTPANFGWANGAPEDRQTEARWVLRHEVFPHGT